MLRILPDTNVLLGIRELDLLMRCHAAGILEVVWCDELLDEFERKLVDVWGFPGERAVKTVQKFTAAAPGGGRILPGTYTGLVGEMTGKDPDDHVLGAAAWQVRTSFSLTISTTFPAKISAQIAHPAIPVTCSRAWLSCIQRTSPR